MGYRIEYLAKCYNDETGKIIEQRVLKVKTINLPKSFHEFGLRHKEQVELIKQSQDFLLDIQCKYFSEIDACPKCGGKTYKQGTFISEFHDVYTDHKVAIARMRCTCGWTSNTSVKGLYGSSSHPEARKVTKL